MRFSVIIPLYNKEKYVKETIESVLSQDFEDYEIIVVDDGSTDSSYKIVEKLNNKKILLFKKKNSGVSDTRNYGIKKANGEYICFLDADDKWSKDYLSTMNNLINDYPFCQMYSLGYQIKYKHRVYTPNFNFLINKRGEVDDFISVFARKESIINSSCVAVNKKILDKIDLFPTGEVVGEDLDLWFRIGKNYKMAYDLKICSFYDRTVESNARTRNKIYYPKSLLENINECLEKDKLTSNQYKLLKKLRDRKMVVYIFSLINAKDKYNAKKELVFWKPEKNYLIYKILLYMLLFLPNGFVNFIQNQRIRRIN